MSLKGLAALCLLPAAIAADRYQASEPHMGTLATITLYADNPDDAARAFRAAFDRIAALDAALSDYRVDSELNRACTARGPLSPDLLEVLSHAQRLSQRTAGAFDITAGAMTRLWRQARREGRLPSPEAMAEARRQSGFRNLRLDPQTGRVECLAEGMQLDPGGIAKGYAGDQALLALRTAGIHRALVALSGDVVAGDAPPGRPGWRVQALGETLVLSDAAVSTSGDEFQVLQVGNERYSHILDPRTGSPLRSAPHVSVVARRGIEADSIATAVSVGGAQVAELLRAAGNVRITVRQVPENGSARSRDRR